jgi:hypothetical protein
MLGADASYQLEIKCSWKQVSHDMILGGVTLVINLQGHTLKRKELLICDPTKMESVRVVLELDQDSAVSWTHNDQNMSQVSALQVL